MTTIWRLPQLGDGFVAPAMLVSVEGKRDEH
jgi:hypothetical protein